MSVGSARILEDSSHVGSFWIGDILGELPFICLWVLVRAIALCKEEYRTCLLGSATKETYRSIHHQVALTPWDLAWTLDPQPLGMPLYSY